MRLCCLSLVKVWLMCIGVMFSVFVSFDWLIGRLQDGLCVIFIVVRCMNSLFSKCVSCLIVECWLRLIVYLCWIVVLISVFYQNVCSICGCELVSVLMLLGVICMYLIGVSVRIEWFICLKMKMLMLQMLFGNVKLMIWWWLFFSSLQWYVYFWMISCMQCVGLFLCVMFCLVVVWQCVLFQMVLSVDIFLVEKCVKDDSFCVSKLVDVKLCFILNLL